MDEHKTCTVRIAFDVYKNIKELAIKEKRSISFLAAEAMNEYVNSRKQKENFIIKID